MRSGSCLVSSCSTACHPRDRTYAASAAETGASLGLGEHAGVDRQPHRLSFDHNGDQPAGARLGGRLSRFRDAYLDDVVQQLVELLHRDLQQLGHSTKLPPAPRRPVDVTCRRSRATSRSTTFPPVRPGRRGATATTTHPAELAVGRSYLWGSRCGDDRCRHLRLGNQGIHRLTVRTGPDSLGPGRTRTADALQRSIDAFPPNAQPYYKSILRIPQLALTT